MRGFCLRERTPECNRIFERNLPREKYEILFSRRNRINPRPDSIFNHTHAIRINAVGTLPDVQEPPAGKHDKRALENPSRHTEYNSLFPIPFLLVPIHLW